MAPTKDEFDCKAWAYFSDVDLVSRWTLHGPLTGLEEMDFMLSAENFSIYCKLNGKLPIGEVSSYLCLRMIILEPTRSGLVWSGMEVDKRSILVHRRGHSCS